MRLQLKRAGYLAQRSNRYIPLAALDSADIGPMQTGAMPKLVLRQPKSLTPLADNERKGS
jgi:hypothetical protein